MSKHIEQLKIIKVELTPKDMARLFAEFDASEQAEFFNEIAECASKWQAPFEFQLQSITDDEGLTLSGRRVMQGIGEYSHWGITPK